MPINQELRGIARRYGVAKWEKKAVLKNVPSIKDPDRAQNIADALYIVDAKIAQARKEFGDAKGANS